MKDAYFILVDLGNDLGSIKYKKGSYVVEDGLMGACIFSKKNAQRLIDEQGASNARIAHVSELETLWKLK